MGFHRSKEPAEKKVDGEKKTVKSSHTRRARICAGSRSQAGYNGGV